MMANFIPVMSIFVAFIIIASVPSYASECSLSNIEILRQFIDNRINATVSTLVAEFTTILEKSINATLNALGDKIAAVNMTVSVLNATVDEEIAAVNMTVSVLNATVDEKIAAVNMTVSVLNATVDEKIAAVNTTVRVLNATVDERITTVGTTVGTHDVSISKLLGQPVIKMVYIALSGTGQRTVVLRSMDSSTQAVGDTISTLTIINISEDYTSNNGVLAYRPNHSSHSGGNTAIVFINLEAAIPCYQRNQIGPACQLFTLEEDGFQFGKAFIQASDIGNHLRIFSSSQNIATYGFGVTGCSTFDQACVSTFEVALVCLLPPALDQCGI